MLNGEVSPWSPLTNGVEEGSVLEPILIIIYINDIDVGLNDLVFRFVDDPKTSNSMFTEDDRLK